MSTCLKSENTNRCVCCGNEIPEGLWVCPNCKKNIDDSVWKSIFRTADMNIK